MSETHTSTHNPATKPLPPWHGKTVTVERDGVLSPVFKTAKFGKLAGGGSLAGQEYLCPEVTEENFEHWMKWYGRADVISAFGTMLRRDFSGLHISNIGDKRHEGKFDFEQWLEEAADLSAGRETLKDIDEQISSLQETVTELMDKPEFVKFLETLEVTPTVQDIQVALKEAQGQLKPLRVRRDEIQKDYDARAAKRAEKKAAEKAKKEAEEAAKKAATEAAQAA